MSARPRAIVVVPAEHGGAETGDRVVLRRLTAFLETRYDCEVLAFRRLGRVRKSLNVLLHLLPLELAPYWRARYRRDLRDALARRRPDQVFILHEGLFPLGPEAPAAGVPLTLFAHNMLSRFRLDSPAQPVLAWLCRRFERRWYAQAGARLVLISASDRAQAARPGIAPADAPVAAPGAPPASPLADGARFTGEAVATGSYDWWRKRRDLRSFGDTARALDLGVFDPLAAELLPGTRLLDAAATDWSSALRVGVITDTFAGGFKLKALEYVARNCVVFSRAAVRADFEGVAGVDDFVVDDLPEAQWPARIAALRAEDPAALRDRFAAFKAACLARFDWNRRLQAIDPGGLAGSTAEPSAQRPGADPVHAQDLGQADVGGGGAAPLASHG